MDIKKLNARGFISNEEYLEFINSCTDKGLLKDLECYFAVESNTSEETDEEKLAEKEAKKLAKKLAKEEAEKLAKEEAEKLAKEEAEKLAKEEAEKLAKEEAEKLAKESNKDSK